MLQPLIHYSIHFGLPLMVAILFFKPYWKMAFLIMVSCMLIDFDHLLAYPIFDTNRCSINFHPLHSYFAIGIYLVLVIFKKTRILGIGLLIHIIADATDCLLMQF